MNFKNSRIIYSYDGSFDGFLCCVFESFKRKEIPEDILSSKDPQPCLFEQYRIDCDKSKALRVKNFISEKMGYDALELMGETMFTCLLRKEMHMLAFARLGCKEGSKIMTMQAKDCVNVLIKAVKFLKNEANLFKEFIRFSEINGTLFASIKPKNFVLPFTAAHFSERFPNEKFIIVDETNKAVCAYAKGKCVISQADDISLPKQVKNDAFYEELWAAFYDTAAIKERINLKCRMGHMPKRYWDKMTEFTTARK
ncbi:MAG: TIGR03915 family putative DNA repair protein [Endomicrobium sp.]|jgi:probable DNA metabolism protein|nr:TIGR03915 family putative DNA repair protein [Endomicrobium sp.]